MVGSASLKRDNLGSIDLKEKKTSVKPWPWKKVTNSRSREIRTTRAMASKK